MFQSSGVRVEGVLVKISGFFSLQKGVFQKNCLCSFLLSSSNFFSSQSSVLIKEIVLLKSWGRAVVVQSEVALSCYKGGTGHAEMLVKYGDRFMNLSILFSYM